MLEHKNISLKLKVKGISDDDDDMMMEAGTVSKTLEIHSILTWLIAREDSFAWNILFS
jgi:hypothetical protein